MFKKIVIAASLSVLASSAFAAEPFYVGADLTSSKLDDVSGHKSGYGVFAGYQFTENFAVEAGFSRLADTDVFYGSTKVGVKVDQTALSVIGTLPLSNGFNVFGRLGYNRLEADASVGGVSGNDSTSKVLYGVGVGYAITPQVAARLEVQRPSSDTTTVRAGVSFKF